MIAKYGDYPLDALLKKDALNFLKIWLRFMFTRIDKLVDEITETYKGDSGINFIDAANLPVRGEILHILRSDISYRDFVKTNMTLQDCDDMRDSRASSVPRSRRPVVPIAFLIAFSESDSLIAPISPLIDVASASNAGV